MVVTVGEHGWRIYQRDPVTERIAREFGYAEPQVSHQSVRVRCGWTGQLAHVIVNSDVNGEPYIAISKQKKLKTKDKYRSIGGGIDFHSAEDYRRFMQVMHEAGERAGFVDATDWRG